MSHYNTGTNCQQQSKCLPISDVRKYELVRSVLTRNLLSYHMLSQSNLALLVNASALNYIPRYDN
jgi:hypothetical protein